MERTKHLMQKLADAADLSAETIPGVPVVEIAGECRVIIENHGGVVGYSGQQICVRMAYGIVEISGCHLTIAKMSRCQLVITGRIDRVCLQRGRC